MSQTSRCPDCGRTYSLGDGPCKAERAIGDGQSDDCPSTDTQAIGPDKDQT